MGLWGQTPCRAIGTAGLGALTAQSQWEIQVKAKREKISRFTLSLREKQSHHSGKVSLFVMQWCEVFHKDRKYTGCMDENNEKAHEGQLHVSHAHTLLDGAQQATRRHVKAFKKMLW